MSFDRVDRISEEVRRELAQIIREDLRDPRITGTFSITRVEVTRDLRFAKARVSVLEEESREPLMKALKSAAGYLRRELGQRLGLRYTPEILFELDTNIEYGVRIAALLKKVLPEDAVEKQDDE